MHGGMVLYYIRTTSPAWASMLVSSTVKSYISPMCSVLHFTKLEGDVELVLTARKKYTWFPRAAASRADGIFPPLHITLCPFLPHAPLFIFHTSLSVWFGFNTRWSPWKISHWLYLALPHAPCHLLSLQLCLDSNSSSDLSIVQTLSVHHLSLPALCQETQQSRDGRILLESVAQKKTREKFLVWITLKQYFL